MRYGDQHAHRRRAEHRFKDAEEAVTRNDNIKAGKQTVVTIVSVLDDKDAIGSERIVIQDATFDSLILADWEVDKMGEESYSFTFSDWDLLDLA